MHTIRRCRSEGEPVKVGGNAHGFVIIEIGPVVGMVLRQFPPGFSRARAPGMYAHLGTRLDNPGAARQEEVRSPGKDPAPGVEFGGESPGANVTGGTQVGFIVDRTGNHAHFNDAHLRMLENQTENRRRGGCVDHTVHMGRLAFHTEGSGGALTDPGDTQLLAFQASIPVSVPVGDSPFRTPFHTPVFLIY